MGSDEWFVNERMGQRARVVVLPSETGGHRFVIEYVNRPFAGEFAVPMHFHPAYQETFEILSGKGRYRIGREERTASPGNTVVMAAGVPHVHPWSDSDEELHVRQTAEADPPDLTGLTASIQGAITIFGLAGAGKVNARGLPSILQLAVLARDTMPATFLAGPPRIVQRLGFGLLAGLGRVAGYKTSYPEFGVLTAQGLVRETPEVNVRRAVASDAVALAGFGARTFSETFGADNTPADMAIYLGRTYGAAQQTAELDDPAMTTIVAEADGRLAGYAQLRAGPAPDSVRGPSPIELLRFYVDRPWQGRGLARTVMGAVEAEAEGRGAGVIWLAVWERNERAKSFYRKCGFDDVGSKMFVLGTERQTDRVMVRPLR